MLKENKIKYSHLQLLVRIQLECNSHNIFTRILLPNMFWFFHQSKFFYYTSIKKFFFFKFLEPRYTIKKRLKQKKLNKYRFRNKINRERRVVKWSHINFKSNLNVRKKFFKRPFKKFLKLLNFRRWYYMAFTRYRKYLIRRKFLKFLKQKIFETQIHAGSFLFNTNKKHTLKKLFKNFNFQKNSYVFFMFFFKKFFFHVIFKKKWLKYKTLSFVNLLHSYKNTEIIHITTLKWLLLKWRWTLNKRFVKLRTRFKIAYGFRKRRKFKRIRFIKRKFVRKYKKKKFLKLIVKNSFMHQDLLTQMYFTNFSEKKYINYYFNFILNVWNIRSYNWKQIT